MSDEWRPITGYEHAYRVNRAGDVLSVRRVVRRCNGMPLPVRGRVLVASRTRSRHKFESVTLAAGPRKVSIYPHAVARELFG